MNINSLSGYFNSVPALPPNHAPPTSATSSGNSVGAVGIDSKAAGTFVSATFRALSQTGVPGTLSVASASSVGSLASISPLARTCSSNPLEDLGSFMHTLITALQNQAAHAGQAAAASPVPARAAGTPSSMGMPAATSAGGNGGVGNASRHHQYRQGAPGGGTSQIESSLQNLMQQLSPGSSTAWTTSTPGTAATGVTTDGPALDLLQQSFQTLTNSLGNASGSASTSLSNFLQAFARSLESFGSTGNIVNTHA
ncbi:MAG: hypothetical protein ABI379_02540 [Rhodanobacter sp.]